MTNETVDALAECDHLYERWAGAVEFGNLANADQYVVDLFGRFPSLSAELHSSRNQLAGIRKAIFELMPSDDRPRATYQSCIDEICRILGGEPWGEKQ